MGLQDFWGPLLAWDLFLGGAGAAAYVVSVVFGWFGGAYRRLSRVGIFAGPVLVAVGTLLLLLELGQPLRFWRVLLRPTSSMMSVGALLISLFLILGFVHMALLLFSKLNERTERGLGTVIAVLGFGIMLYTGLLLGLLKAVPFWNTPALPLLFVLSALSTGVAIVLALAYLVRLVRPGLLNVEQVAEPARGVLPAVIVLVFAQLVTLFTLLFLMAGGRVTAADSAAYVFGGEVALAFWLGAVGIGLVLPLVLAGWAVAQKGWTAGRLVNVSLLMAVGLLVGGIVLRYVILSGGASVAATLGPR